MSTFAPTATPAPPVTRLPGWPLHILVALLLVVAAVSSFAVGTVFGAAATFTITVLAAMALPAAMPVLLVCAFMFQNLVVAWYTPAIPDNAAFDALRGANFVILMSAFGLFLLASWQERVRRIAGLRPWLVASILLLALVCVYLALGAIHGVPKDAVVYFRNIVTPIACFHIAIVAASLYRIELEKPLFWIGLAAVLYGYCELVFTMDFLALFHGDLYIERDIWRQIQTGQWEKTLQQTGFVLRSLQDVMTTTFFNSPLLGDLAPKVFRIGGPNFHSISYAYALAILSAWLLGRRRWGLAVLALPLLLVIGSKGAMFLLILSFAAQMMIRAAGTRPTLWFVVLAALLWAGSATAFGMTHGDYHVLGLFAGIREFLGNPLGAGLGFGGNLSAAAVHVDWDLAQASGASEVPMESAIGVLLYQMGIASLALLGFLAAMAAGAGRRLQQTGDRVFLFAFVGVVAIISNALLQEEAFFSPLALGLCLLLVGHAFGDHLRHRMLRTGETRGA